MERPPFSIAVFSFHDIKKTCDYFVNRYNDVIIPRSSVCWIISSLVATFDTWRCINTCLASRRSCSSTRFIAMLPWFVARDAEIGIHARYVQVVPDQFPMLDDAYDQKVADLPCLRMCFLLHVIHDISCPCVYRGSWPETQSNTWFFDVLDRFICVYPI